MYKADSDYTSNKAQKCKSKTDIQNGKDYGFEISFFDIMYLPTCDMYARLHVDAIEFGKTKTWNYYPENGIFIYVCLIMSLIK